jgi:hypothetical protein
MTYLRSYELEGTAETPSDDPTAILVLAPIPFTGSWTAIGTVTCFLPDGSGSVTYYPQFCGVSADGSANEIDAYGTTPMPSQPQTGNLDDSGSIGAPVLVIVSNQVCVQVTGLAGLPLNWGISLKLTIIVPG